MSILVTRRFLTKYERDVLAQETKQSPHIGYINPKAWQSFGKIFTATHDSKLLGVCATIPLSGWVKVGPIIVISSYQGKGIGKQLLTHVAKYYSHLNVYIGSSNPRVIKVVFDLGFQRMSFVGLPWEVKQYLIYYLLQRTSWEYITNALRKKLTSRRFAYKYFVKISESIS